MRTAVARRAVIALALLVAPGAPGHLLAQKPAPPCDPGDCGQPFDDLARSAARISQARADFVTSLRHLLEALPGTYGDEGPALRAAIAGMGQALDRWDRAVREYRAPLEKMSGDADVHVALGTVQFERGRVREAADEFTAASRLAPDRAPVFVLLGLAFDAMRRHEDAAKAFARAAALPPRHAAAAYAAARQWRLAGRPEAALEGFQAFHRAVEPQRPPAAARPQQPFPRAGLLRESAGVAPIWPPARYVPGFDALARGAYADALAAFDRAAAQDPLVRTPPAAAVAPLTSGRAALRAGDLRAALAQLDAAVAAAPDASEPRRLLAVALCADDRCDDAVEQLRHAVRLDPTDERARLALGRTLAATGRIEGAERVFRDTVAAIPMSAQAHFELGRLSDSQGRNAEAAEAFAGAAATRPVLGEERVYELMARARVAATDFDGAIQAFARRVEVSPNYAPAHRALAEVLLQLGRDDEALAELAAAALIDPADAQVHALRAQLHLRSGRYQEAADAARDALARDAASPQALYALGTALLQLGRVAEGEEALARFRAGLDAARARDERGSDLRVLRQSAAARLERGEMADAVERLQAAVALQPDAESYSMLGAALQRAGRPQDALAALEQASARGGGPAVHVLLADVLASLGRMEDSRRHLALAARAREERFRAGAPR